MSLTGKLEHWKTCENETHDFFFILEKDRKNWEPSLVTGNTNFPYQEQIDQCFSRVVALSLDLELPVGAFIRALVEREDDIPKSALKGLVLNIEDEEKHFQAFKQILKAYPTTHIDVEIAAQFRKQVLHAKSHPLVKARDLETILFVPLQTVLRYYGSQSLERTIAFVSLDEYRHIQYNWEISADLNIGFDIEYQNLVFSFVKWCFEPLQDTNLNREFWVDCAQELKEEGQCERIQNIMNYGIHRSPFEISNATY